MVADALREVIERAALFEGTPKDDISERKLVATHFLVHRKNEVLLL